MGALLASLGMLRSTSDADAPSLVTITEEDAFAESFMMRSSPGGRCRVLCVRVIGVRVERTGAPKQCGARSSSSTWYVLWYYGIP